MNKQVTKQRILSATTEMLRSKPMSEITIREIAKLANVNIASIHYHYSFKEALFSHALDQIIFKDLDEWMITHIDFNRLRKSDLIDFLEYLHAACVNQREFAKTRISNNLLSDEANAANIKVYNSILLLTKGLGLGKSEKELKLRTSLLYSSLASISCSVADMELFTDAKLTEALSLRWYIKNVVKTIFGETALS